ncbi:MAG: hypothetical protein ABWY05_15285 [Noviherbaspirillum sp.]
MKAMRALAAMLVVVPYIAMADSVTITDANSNLKYTTDPPIYNLSLPNDPIQFPRTLEWTVDGRRILVYPSGPSTLLDIGHLHFDAHVAANQMHAQGPLYDHGTGSMQGTITGGVVYSVNGGTAGSGTSRISEKVDIHNKTSSAVALSLAGMGYRSPQASLEVPDLTGLNLTGTTVVFYQGNLQTGSITDGAFGPVIVLPVTSFSGFNPLLNENINLPAGAVLTMVTELKIGPRQIVFEIAPSFRDLLSSLRERASFLFSPFSRGP